MMAASPEFYKPPSTPFSPLRPSSLLLPHGDDGDDLYSCRTPTGTGITYLREPTTCPPAPRKAPPPPCKKRLFPNQEQQQVPVISLRLDDLHRIFRPHPHPPPDKRRRSARHHRGKLDAAPQEA